MSVRGKLDRNRIVAVALFSVAIGMAGMAYASVPLYRLFCEVTGYGGTTQRAEAGALETLDREIVVRLDANVSGLPWNFRPEVAEIRVKLGETALVNFIAENVGPRPTTGTATFNVQPDLAGIYFNKIACFCFTEQELAPGQRLKMPVQFFVAPELAGDRHLASMRTITLSYTFFPVAPAGRPIAQAGGDAIDKSL